MFALKKPAQNHTLRLLESTPKESSEDSQKQELRRQMYERIAQGNALSELENKANSHWNK